MDCNLLNGQVMVLLKDIHLHLMNLVLTSLLIQLLQIIILVVQQIVLISIQFTESAHDLSVGDVVNVSGLNAGTAGFSRADGSFIIESIPSANQLKYYARGIVGSSNGETLKTEETIARRGGLYANASIPVQSASSNGSDPSTITLTFANPHGLVPGCPIHTVVGSGTNKANASGPFFIKKTPSLTSLEFTARPGAAVGSPSNVTLYAISNSTILHRPSDGGVILSTKTPTYAASVVRMSKRFFRYQSGKGFLFSSGTLFAPNYDLQSISAAGTAIGSAITIKTDDIDHGLQIGAEVTIDGVKTSGYEDSYVVSAVVDDYTFRVAAKSVLGDTTAILKESSKGICEMHGLVLLFVLDCLMIRTVCSLNMTVTKCSVVYDHQLITLQVQSQQHKTVTS